MKRIAVFICLIAVIFTLVEDSHAQVPQEGMIGRFPATFLDSVNAEDSYENTALSKAGDGLVNATTFWTEIPKGVAEVTDESNVIIGLTVGLGKGLFTGLARGASGVYDTVTCGIPPYDKPAMKPGYRVDNPQKNGYKIKLLKW